MRFLNVKNRSIDNFNKYETKEFAVSDVSAVFLEAPMSRAQEGLRSMLDLDEMNTPIHYHIELEHVDCVNDFEIMCDLITSCIINNNSRLRPERKDIIKTIPDELMNVNCLVVPLLKAINYECKNPIYNITIDAVRGSAEKWHFELLGEDDE